MLKCGVLIRTITTTGLQDNVVLCAVLSCANLFCVACLLWKAREFDARVRQLPCSVGCVVGLGFRVCVSALREAAILFIHCAQVCAREKHRDA